jgi:hypothetical protein
MLHPPTKESAPKLNVLVSYAYMRDVKDEVAQWIYNVPGVRFLLDCGAFTAHNVGKEIDLSEYMDYLVKWKHKFTGGYIALDKIGDPKQTDINLNIMLNRGFKPIPVHVRGDKQERMDELFQYSDLVALGGLRRPHRSEGSSAYVKQKMEWARGRKVHWFGFTRQIMLNTFKPYSCNSSSISGSSRWGRALMYHNQFTPPITYTYKDFLKSKVPLWVHENIQQLGFTYEDFLDGERWRGHRGRNLASILSHASSMKHSMDVERVLGTKFYLSMNTSTMYELFVGYARIMNIPYCSAEKIPRSLT